MGYPQVMPQERVMKSTLLMVAKSCGVHEWMGRLFCLTWRDQDVESVIGLAHLGWESKMVMDLDDERMLFGERWTESLKLI
jgi:hypothetical protein